MKATALFSAALLCGLSSFTATAEQDKHALLVEWMQGHFDSEQQSKADKDFFNIHLNMAKIWPKEAGTWLYVEQAAATHLDEPYRQRVYQVTQITDNEFASKVYTFDNGKSYAGAYKSAAPLANLSPANLTERAGCTVYLTWDETQQHFNGSTKANECESNLRGASYATSDVTVTKDKIVSWDRGYDINDKQVWGAEKAGYIFMKSQSLK